MAATAQVLFHVLSARETVRLHAGLVQDQANSVVVDVQAVGNLLVRFVPELVKPLARFAKAPAETFTVGITVFATERERLSAGIVLVGGEDPAVPVMDRVHVAATNVLVKEKESASIATAMRRFSAQFATELANFRAESVDHRGRSAVHTAKVAASSSTPKSIVSVLDLCHSCGNSGQKRRSYRVSLVCDGLGSAGRRGENAKVGARKKLNQAYFNGSLIIAAVIGLLTQSWLIFGAVLAVMLWLNVASGNIRYSHSAPQNSS